MTDITRCYLTLFALKTIFNRCEMWRSIKKMGDILILDAGCGEGGSVALIAKHDKFKVIGLDIFRPNLEKLHRLNICYDLVQGDVRHLPFRNKSIDMAVSLEVLEHFEKCDGEELLDEFDRVSKRLVVMSCPINKWEQKPHSGNPYQEHKHVWTIDELKDVGFQNIRGIGLRGMSGELWGRLLRSFISPLLYTLILFGTLFSYFIPRIAEGVIAWKEIPQGSEV